MGIINKIIDTLSKKSVTQYGGLELLSRLTGGKWSKGKMLEQYEKSLYVFACVSKIAEKVASTDLNLYQILNERGDTREIINHPALDLLYKVNPFQTKSEFLKITVINQKLSGDAFWYKVRNERGEVMELWNLRPDYMEIIKDPELFIKGYRLNKTDGTSAYFDPDDIVHFKYPSPLDDYFGTSPVKSASVRIDTENYASNFQRDFFLNNGRPDGILKSTGGMPLTEEQTSDIRREFEKRHKGRGKNSRIAVIEGDLEYQQISINQREMDFIESMKFTRDDILVAFGVPKTVVAITDDVNRANAETAMYVFLSEVVKPELEMLVEKINEMLIIPEYGDNYFIDFLDPTPQNREQLVKEYETGLTKGYYLINEVRAKENLEPIEGGWTLYKPLGEIAVGGLSKTKQFNIAKKWVERIEKENKERKLKVFRGRELLLRKFELKTELKAELKKVFNITVDKKEKILDSKKQKQVNKKDKALVSLIKGEDLREKYIDITIKQIDQRSEKLKKDMSGLAKKQEDELLITLGKLDITKTKSEAKRKKIGKEINAELAVFYAGQADIFATFILPYVEQYARSAGLEAMLMVEPNKSFEMTPAIIKKLEKQSKQFGLGVNKTTRKKITGVIETGLLEGEGMAKISDRIQGVYDEFPLWRSDLIARTEATAANNEGFLESYKQSDVATHKEWIATMDDRTRDEHVALDGEIVAVDKDFSNGLPYPSEPNCRCVVGPAFEN